MITMERIQEDIDVLGLPGLGTDSIKVSRERLRHLRAIEQLAIEFHDRLMDEACLRRALALQFAEKGSEPNKARRGDAR